MEAERWQTIETIYHAALTRPAEERNAYVVEACAGDTELCAEVQILIARHEESGSFIDTPVFDLGVRALAEQTPLSAGKTVGHYVILDIIGRGGMGEVYLARDPRLGRKVALKLLPVELKSDRDRVQRFRQEARAASAVSHPNIAHVYDVGEADGRLYTAIEYVDGISLRQLIVESKIDTHRAVDIAIQVAEALAAAHASGVVHRDIKPENIMMRHDGYVKVLDFGLAKLVQQLMSGAVSDFEAPTTPMVHSEPGLVMGTVKYMSPEQARGKTVDARTDIWSLGVVLYEMVTGRAPFDGETMSDVIVQILDREPQALTEIALHLPAKLNEAITKALRKEPSQRYQTAQEFASNLKSVRHDLQAPVEVNPDLTGSLRDKGSDVGLKHRRIFFLLALGLLTLSLTVLVLVRKAPFFQRPMQQTDVPFQSMEVKKLTQSQKAKPENIGISPDGKYVAYVEAVGGKEGLTLLQVNTSGTIKIVEPFDGEFRGLTFSPDNEYVFYVNWRKGSPYPNLHQVPVLGGPSKQVIEHVNCRVSFSPDGRQFTFVRTLTSGWSQLIVAQFDGTNERVLATREASVVEGFKSPTWSPDGKRVACVSAGFTGNASDRVVEVDVANGQKTDIGTKSWFDINELLWLRDGSGFIVSGALDREPARQLWQLSYPAGEPSRITNDTSNYVGLSVSSDGQSLVALQGNLTPSLWVMPGGDHDRAKEIRRNSFFGGWTPDGRIVHTSMEAGEPDIWIMNTDGSDQEQITSKSIGNYMPVVSPDGRIIVFISARSGRQEVWRMDLDGGNQKQLTDSEKEVFFPDISPDGQWVIYATIVSNMPAIMKVPIGGGSSQRLTDEPAGNPFVSPDGKTIACMYSLNPDAPPVVALIPIEGGKPIKTVSIKVPTADVPNLPFRWGPDGKSLTLLDPSENFMNLWTLPLDGGPPRKITAFVSDQIVHYAWSRDGKQLLLTRGTETSDVVLIRNFNK